MRIKDKSRTLISIAVHGVYLILIYALQACVFTWIPLFGLVPLILPVAVAGIAMTEGITVGGVCGIFGGMLCDVAFNSPTMVYTITLTVIGLGVAYLTETVLSKSFITYLVVNAAALIVVSAVQGFSLVFFTGQAFLPILFATVFQTVYSLVFSVPLFFAARFVGRTCSGI